MFIPIQRVEVEVSQGEISGFCLALPTLWAAAAEGLGS